jgi:hypothetical protein
MVLGASGVHRRFFRQKSDPKMQFGCRAQKFMHYSGVKLFTICCTGGRLVGIDARGRASLIVHIKKDAFGRTERSTRLTAKLCSERFRQSKLKEGGMSIIHIHKLFLITIPLPIPYGCTTGQTEG